MKIIRSLALLAASLAAVHTAHAVTYINDVFDTGNYTTGALIGQDTPAWQITGTSVVNPVSVTGGNVVLTTTGQDVDQAFIGGNLTPVNGTSLYTVANITVTSATTGDYFLHFSVGPGNSSLFYQRLFVRSDSTGFDLGILANSGNTTAPTYGSELSFNTPLQVVVAWDFIAGAANDQFSIYVNPTAIRANDTAYATATWTSSGAGTAAEPTDLGSINFRQGATGASAGVEVSSVGVSDSFPVTSTVPEPADFAIGLGAAALGLVAWRRSRCTA